MENTTEAPTDARAPDDRRQAAGCSAAVTAWSAGAEEVPELQARLADRRVVHDRQEARRIRHERAVEQRLVVVEQVRQVHVTVDVARLVRELQQHASQLQVLALGRVGDEADQAQFRAFRLGERRGLVEGGVVEQVMPVFFMVVLMVVCVVVCVVRGFRIRRPGGPPAGAHRASTSPGRGRAGW